MAKRPKPKQIVVNGERFYAQVFQIFSEHPSTGEPRECKMLLPKEVVHLQGGEKFMVCYVSEHMLTTDEPEFLT